MKNHFLLLLMLAVSVLAYGQKELPTNKNSHNLTQQDSEPISDYIDIGNIQTVINSNGLLFWDNESRIFEVPKNSGKHTIFNSNLWIGGMDEDNNLHLAANRYNQVEGSSELSFDYSWGPVSNQYDEQFDDRWNSLWKLTKTDIDNHIQNWDTQDYEPIQAIATWPAHGNVENGESYTIAPFYDYDQDGIYDPRKGDFPLIRGDQAIFFVINDDRYPHIELGSEALKIELHVMAYAFDKPEDPLLFNSIFLHYDIINRSENEYHDTYIGTFTDFDIGHFNDDYIACDVKGSSFYAYNGKDVDGNGQSWSYGNYPPAQSTTFLAGPYMDDNFEDDPNDVLNHSYNGVGFGDGTVDNERMGMTNFIVYDNQAAYTDELNGAMELYSSMKSIWKDNTHLIYGGNGHLSSGGAGPECRFMFPGDSDPDNWGTDGVAPNDGYNENGKFWTEEEAENPSGDRRGIGSCGPFTFSSGAKQEFDIAYIFAQSDQPNDPMGSVSILHDRIADAKERVTEGELIYLSESNVGQKENYNLSTLMFYPNPAQDLVRIVFNKENSLISGKYQIVNLSGVVIESGELANNSNLDVHSLTNGVYIVRVISENTIFSGKLIIK